MPLPAEELADDWSSGDEEDSEDQAAHRAQQRGRPRGGKNQPLAAKQRGGKAAMALISEEDKQRGRSLGGATQPLWAKPLGAKAGKAAVLKAALCVEKYES